MDTWSKFIFLYQVNNGATELAKKLGAQRRHIERILDQEIPMSKNIAREVEELYALREDCLARTARWKEAEAISLHAH